MANEVLKKEIERKGGVRQVAQALGLSTQAIYLYINEKREPSDNLLNYLGLEKRLMRINAKGQNEEE